MGSPCIPACSLYHVWLTVKFWHPWAHPYLVRYAHWSCTWCHSNVRLQTILMLPFSFYTCHRLVANSSHLHLAFLVTASVSPEYLLEIQILKLSPKVKESETLEMELCTFTSFLGDCRICVKLENRRSGSWMGRKSTDNNRCVRRLLLLEPWVFQRKWLYLS